MSLSTIVHDTNADRTKEFASLLIEEYDTHATIGYLFCQDISTAQQAASAKSRGDLNIEDSRRSNFEMVSPSALKKKILRRLFS